MWCVNPNLIKMSARTQPLKSLRTPLFLYRCFWWAVTFTAEPATVLSGDFHCCILITAAEPSIHNIMTYKHFSVTFHICTVKLMQKSYIHIRIYEKRRVFQNFWAAVYVISIKTKVRELTDDEPMKFHTIRFCTLWYSLLVPISSEACRGVRLCYLHISYRR